MTDALKPFKERTDIIEAYLHDVAQREDWGCGGILPAEAIDLLNLLDGLRDDLRVCREANEDYAELARIDADELNDAEYEAEGLRQELAHAHEAYDRLHHYTRGACRVYAKEVKRLIEERDALDRELDAAEARAEDSYDLGYGDARIDYSTD